MLSKIADELKRFDASIDVINREQAERAIEAALGAVRRLLGAMTVEVFYMSEKQVHETIHGERGTRTIPYFLRFAKDLDSGDRDALEKREIDDYNPQAFGPWTWSYDKNHVVWIEHKRDTMDGRPGMVNKAVEGEIIDEEHNIFWRSVLSVITIPFSYKLGTTFADSHSRQNTKGLISYKANGFISFEFKCPKKYSEVQRNELVRISEYVADLIWKSHAWQDSCDGTNHAVTKFEEECNRAKESFLPIKTGLFAPKRQGDERLTEPIQTTFTDSKIEMKTYDGVSDALGLLQASQDMTQSIRNVHFAVLDITEKNLVVDMLVGIMFAECKPCLILHENSEVARHPLIRELAVRAGQNTNQLLYPWFYERQPNGEGYLFFKSSNGERTTWSEVWEDFLRKVEEILPTFQIADDSI